MKSTILLAISFLLSCGSSLAATGTSSDYPDTFSNTMLKQGPTDRRDGTTQAAIDTRPLQTQVLTKINEALSRGSVSPEQAANLKEQLNKMNEKESWFKSFDLPIPAKVVEEDTTILNALSAKVYQQIPLKPTPSPRDAAHVDIQKLISTALAQHKISNEESELYYSRLVRTEADIESLSSDPARSTSEVAALRQNLNQLRSELKTRLL